MDNTKRLPSVLSFCTGYGGIEIGLERAIGTINILVHVEIEAYAVANLLAKMGTGDLVPAPVWTDIKTFPAHCFSGSVDILTCGYPCQPFSAAGQRRGADDPRHLWPWIKEHISIIRPGICFFENVEGHVSLGLREVLTDLVGLRYRVESDSGEPTWGLFSAAEVGAPHRRKRVFILAYDQDKRDNLWRFNVSQAQAGWESINSEAGNCCNNVADPGSTEFNRVSESTERKEDQAPWVSGAIVANSCQQGPQNTELQAIQPAWRRNERRTTAKFCCSLWPSRPGEPQYEWEEPRVLANASQQLQHGDRDTWPTGRGESTDQSERKTKSFMGGSVDGPAKTLDTTAHELDAVNKNRCDRLRLLGNGVVPATAEKAFITLINRIKNPGRNIKQVEIQMELF